MIERRTERIVWVDLLRIVATWGVVFIHSHRIVEYNLHDPQMYEMVFWGGLTQACVPLFLMISGMLVLRNDIQVASMKRMVPKVISLRIVSIVLCGTFCMVWGGVLEMVYLIPNSLSQALRNGLMGMTIFMYFLAAILFPHFYQGLLKIRFWKCTFLFVLLLFVLLFLHLLIYNMFMIIVREFIV